MYMLNTFVDCNATQSYTWNSTVTSLTWSPYVFFGPSDFKASEQGTTIWIIG